MKVTSFELRKTGGECVPSDYGYSHCEYSTDISYYYPVPFNYVVMGWVYIVRLAISALSRLV